MFETGLAIFLGLVFIFIKLPRRTMLRLLNHDMAIDVCVTLVVLAIHAGTFTAASMAQKAADYLLPPQATAPNPQASAIPALA